MKARLSILAIATAVIVGLSYFGWSAPSAQSSGVSGSRSQGYAAVVDQHELQRLIAAYEDRVQTHPNAADFAFLTQLYLQRGRQTGDLQTYLQADHAITEALALDPTDPGNLQLLATLRYTTHDFPAALDLARHMLTVNPGQVGALTVAGDAQLELGMYDGAADAYGKVAAGSPDAPAIEVRQARLDFIQGRIDQARQMAAKAETDAVASALGGPDLAYYETYRGQVELDTGHYDRAARYYRQALQEAPNYYIGLAGLGRALATQGHLDDAIAAYEKAVTIIPQPDFLAALGDLYTVKGDTRKAKLEYGTIDVIATLAKINQQVYNRLVALFYADHGLQPAEALRLTQTELTVRHDVYGYDAYAWALYENRDYTQARDASDHALAQGTVDPKLLYHAGMIAKALGDTTRARADLARALAISPNFDPLQAPRARAALAELG
jgi:tetratricopeptide (TPR) repeat protein